MSLATVTTLGYSVAGGLQAGPYFLAPIGYTLGAPLELPDAGVEWTVPVGRAHWTLPVGRAHWTVPKEDAG